MNQVETVSETWKVIGWNEKTFQAYPGAPVRAGASCEKCGQSIRYVVTVQSTNGYVMNVGQDCAVTLEGGPALREIRNAERAWKAAEDERLHGAERRRHAADLKTRLALAAAQNEIDLAWTLAGLRLIVSSPACSDWQKSKAEWHLRGFEKGNFTNDLDVEERLQLFPAICAALAPVSKHIGQPGVKLVLSAVLEAIIPVGLDSPYGPKYLHKFRTSHGECLTWFASGSAGARSGDVGKTMTVKGTVKELSDYQGVPQTVLTRCKLS